MTASRTGSLLAVAVLAAIVLGAACLVPGHAEARPSAPAVTTAEAPLVQAGDMSAFRARSGSSVPSGTGTTMSALSTGSLGKSTRRTLGKRFAQAVESMKTVKSARFVGVSSLKIKASDKRDRAIARLFGNIVNFHPEYFYVSNMVKFVRGSDGRYKTIELGYAYKFSSLEKKLRSCEKGLKNLLGWVPADGTDLEKVKAVHDWLVRNCTYDANADYEKDRWSPYNIYGALVSHKPVCQGYSLAFLLAMQQLGIKATCVGQYIGNRGHMWNRVKVDGHWYHVDLTYDDPLTNVTLPSYRDRGFYATPDTTYFMKSDAWWKKNAASGGWHKSWFPQGTAGTDTSHDSQKLWPTYYSRAKSPSKPTGIIVDLDEVAKGTRSVVGKGASKAVYRVTGAGTASYHRCKVAKGAREARVASSVKIGGKSFSVTGISSGAFAGRKNVSLVTVKTKRLTQKGVRGCFSGSKVSKAMVPATAKGTYRQYFAKANSGRSVKVRALAS